MRMRGPVDPDIKGPVTHQSFEQPSNIPVPDATERVEFPVGLYKSVYVSVVADQVRACQRFESTQEMELMKCSLALRRTADAPFEWKDHYVFRFTVPAQYVGRMLKWMDDNEFSHPGGWSVRTVEAVYSPELVDVKFNFTPDVGNYERLFIVFKPLEDLDLSTRLQYEMDVAHMEPPPR